MYFFTKKKKREQRNKKINARKVKRKIKDSHIKYTRDIMEKIQLNSFKTKYLNAGENVRSLGEFYRMDIIVLKNRVCVCEHTNTYTQMCVCLCVLSVEHTLEDISSWIGY